MGDPSNGIDKSAEAEFTAWFRKNYPGPDTIIYDPDWHSPKIYRAATRALAAERDAGLTREKNANEKAVQHLRRAEKAEIASKNHAAFSHEWRGRAESAEAERNALQDKLDEAVKALEWISTEERLDHINGGLCLTDGAEIARAAIAKLRGADDE